MPKRKYSDDEKESKKKKVQQESSQSTDNKHITKLKQNKSKEKDNIPWPESDVLELIDKIEKKIPEDDNLSYGGRLEKIDWDDVAFKQHSIKECKEVWSILLKQIRKFRLLKEITTDMKSWLQSPKTASHKDSIIRHPEKPKQPPNNYLLFAEEKRYEVMREYPNLPPNDIARKLGEIFKSLPLHEKEKYNKLAKTARAEYTEKLKNFYAEHPAMIPKKTKQSKSVDLEGRGPPEKPKTPFQLFVQVESENVDTDEPRYCINQRCRDSWSEMSDKDKLFWIKWAEEQYNKYVDDLKEYIKIHPDYEPEKMKTILTKKEKKIRDRYSGKPDKPPHSAYHLFTKMIMESEEVRQISYKEAVIYISEKWRACPEDEKNEYKTRVEQMWEEYNKELDEYVMSLPPEERDKVRRVNKRKKLESKETKTLKQKKYVNKVSKPELPPKTDYKYFLTTYKGKENPLEVWQNMTEDEKQVIANKLTEVKQEYVVQYEEYMKGLSKEELKKIGESQGYPYDTSSDSEAE